jgi:POTRA domain-containing FtsQ-type protein
MPEARTPSKWPYRAGKPSRMKRVVKERNPEPQGVLRREKPQPRMLVTPMQARLALLALMLFVAIASAWWLYQSPWLTVQKVTVTGNSRLTVEQVEAAAGLDGKSGLSLDTAGAQARVAALPNVRSAKVTQHGWNAVEISVEERVPWGSWQINGFNVPVDIDGYVLDTPAPEGSPVIVEVAPQRVINTGDRLDGGAIDLASRLVKDSNTAFGRTVLGLVYRQSAGLTAILSGQTEDAPPLWVTFGDSRDYDYKIAALYVLIEQAQENELALNTVDLRFGDRLSFN